MIYIIMLYSLQTGDQFSDILTFTNSGIYNDLFFTLSVATIIYIVVAKIETIKFLKDKAIIRDLIWIIILFSIYLIYQVLGEPFSFDSFDILIVVIFMIRVIAKASQEEKKEKE